MIYHFIINPNAGSGNGGKIWNRVSRYLERHNIEYEAVLANGKGDARCAARELTERLHEMVCLIVVGGDGTVNEVLDGVCFHSLLNLGYIPAVSGSDLSRSLRLPGRALKCLKKQLAPKHCTMMDYGVLSYGTNELYHRRFLVSAGIGFDAAVCERAQTSRLCHGLTRAGLEKLAYFLLGIRQFLKCRPSKGYIILDGVKKVEFNHILFISCHIQPTEGNGFLFAPKAEANDGKMNVCVFSHARRTKLIPVLLAAFTGKRVKYKGARVFECREISIHTETALPVHADGEMCGVQTDIHADCIPRKVRMLA